MRHRLNRLSVFALLMCGLAAAGFGQTRRMKFTVKDSAGNLVDGVAIAMVSPQNDTLKKSVVTDKKGQSTFLLPMEITDLNVVLEKKGFQKLEKSLVLRNLRSAQDSFSYEESFLMYRASEKSPEQQYKEYQDNLEARAQFDRGIKLFQQEDFTGAIEVFKRAVEINPKFVEAYQNLAAAHFRLEAYEKAIEAAKKALELMPDSSQTLKLISVAYSALGDEKTALEYQEKLKDLPDAQFSPEELYNMGVVEANEGRDPQAVDYFKKAVEMKPDLAIAFYQLGLTQFRLKNNAEAKAALEKYLELEPNGENVETAKKLLEFIKQ